MVEATPEVLTLTDVNAKLYYRIEATNKKFHRK